MYISETKSQKKLKTMMSDTYNLIVAKNSMKETKTNKVKQKNKNKNT